MYKTLRYIKKKTNNISNYILISIPCITMLCSCMFFNIHLSISKSNCNIKLVTKCVLQHALWVKSNQTLFIIFTHTHSHTQTYTNTHTHNPVMFFIQFSSLKTFIISLYFRSDFILNPKTLFTDTKKTQRTHFNWILKYVFKFSATCFPCMLLFWLLLFWWMENREKLSNTFFFVVW